MRWVKIDPNQANEPLDCRNYAQAALDLVNPNWDLLEERLNKGVEKTVQLPKNGRQALPKRRGLVKKGMSF